MAEPVTRIFLVGFPRSGTTLLQSLLAAHPQVMSLPETFFFVRVSPSSRRRRWLRRPAADAGAGLSELQRHGIEVPPAGLRERIPVGSLGPTIRRFARGLDQSAARAARRAWVEKTPSHLHYLATIESYLPEAHFLHIVRAGLPAIASLYAVTQEHPERWGGARPLAVCVERWQSDIRRSHSRAASPLHTFVSYERLVEDPAALLATLTHRLGLRSDPQTIDSMTSGYALTTSQIVDDEPWKSAVGAKITNRNAARVDELIPAGDRAAIELRIAPE